MENIKSWPGGIDDLGLLIPIGFTSDYKERVSEVSQDASSASDPFFNPKSLYITIDGRDIDQYNVC